MDAKKIQEQLTEYYSLRAAADRLLNQGDSLGAWALEDAVLDLRATLEDQGITGL